MSALTHFQTSGRAWWETAISRVRPNHIEVRGYPIEELIGRVSFTDMITLLALGRILTDDQRQLLDAALVAGADHGPRAPSIAAARMAATCGVSFNSAVATGINMLGDFHGGAVEGFMACIAGLSCVAANDEPNAALHLVNQYRARREPVPGFGHQLHDYDPRRDRLIELVRQATQSEIVGGQYLSLALAVESALQDVVGKGIPLNVDGATGVIYLELGFPAEVAKGLFSLSRGAGIVAHALEERQTGTRIKGPCPPDEDLIAYVGPASRSLLTGRDR